MLVRFQQGTPSALPLTFADFRSTALNRCFQAKKRFLEFRNSSRFQTFQGCAQGISLGSTNEVVPPMARKVAPCPMCNAAQLHPQTVWNTNNRPVAVSKV